MAFPAELKSKFIELLTQKKLTFSANGWNNFMGGVTNPAALMIEINDEEQLKFILKEILRLNNDRTHENKITIRAANGWSDTPSQCCGFFPWNQQQPNQYNESYSFSEVVGGRAIPDAIGAPATDIVIRFTKKFHHMEVIGNLPRAWKVNPDNPIHQLPCSLVEVSAGVQVAELATFLRNKNLSLSTVSMISWVSAVGLAGTGGHGTGRDEPAFSGLIEQLRICDMDGEIREIDATHPDFARLCSAHSGLLGIVLSVRLRAVQAFNLCETIEVFPNLLPMVGRLGLILQENQYVSLMGIPNYLSTSSNNPTWQIRKWNYTKDAPKTLVSAPYDADVRSLNQDIELKIGAATMDFLLDSGLKSLLPTFMMLSAAMVIERRGTNTLIDYENHITHPQVAFPKTMRDVSYLIPVKDSEAGPVLERILMEIERLFNVGAKKGEFPITYAIYVRYFAGTSGGLSTSGTVSNDERILAIDMVTHPEAPGIIAFEQQFMAFLKQNRWYPRNHLGKNFPAGVERYDQFLDKEEIEQYCQALTRWHQSAAGNDGVERLAKSPFLTPYLNTMLTSSLAIEAQKTTKETKVVRPRQRPHRDHNDVECRDFLNKLHGEVSRREVKHNETEALKQRFLRECADEIARRTAKIESAVVPH